MVLHQGEASLENRLYGLGTAGRSGISQALLLLAAPAIGLLFILLLPFAWLVAGAVMFAWKAAVVLIKAAGRSISFGWRPVEAYLAGRRRTRTRR